MKFLPLSKSAARTHWTVCGGMDFGESRSATVYVHALIDWEAGQAHEAFGRLPRLWFDREVFGHRLQIGTAEITTTEVNIGQRPDTRDIPINYFRRRTRTARVAIAKTIA